ncbi:hypothetical protein BH160DRAFT_7081 [Burkholderia sp. H160]|nr:hypothetical protein BH160DRAFT_7081 [Burkholderia sp. H160]
MAEMTMYGGCVARSAVGAACARPLRILQKPVAFLIEILAGAEWGFKPAAHERGSDRLAQPFQAIRISGPCAAIALPSARSGASSVTR